MFRSSCVEITNTPMKVRFSSWAGEMAKIIYVQNGRHETIVVYLYGLRMYIIRMFLVGDQVMVSTDLEADLSSLKAIGQRPNV